MDRLSRRVEMREDKISKIQKRAIGFTQSEQQREKRLGEKHNEKSLRDLQGNNKRTTIYITGVPEGEKKYSETKNK